jgi:hypothetical protein
MLNPREKQVLAPKINSKKKNPKKSKEHTRK